VKRTLPASRQVGRRRRSHRLDCEGLELRLQPTAFAFSTGIPDGKIATIAEPANAHNSQVEFESADDFVLGSETVIRHASFTGLLTGGATPEDVSNVVVEIYRLFPKDSDTTRTPGVPTRFNSPSDVAFQSRDSADKGLNFDVDVLSARFTAQASVSSADKIGVNSKGNGPVTGEEVEFDITFRNHPLDLPPDHYFFVPQVGLSDGAPAGAHFLWLSAAKPVVPPGTPFPPGATDLQSWMRDDPPLAPDWLRIGTDIIKDGSPPTFTTYNAAFELSGQVVKRQDDDLAPDPAANGLVGVLPQPAEERVVAWGAVAQDPADAAATQPAAVGAVGLDSALAVGRGGRWQRYVAGLHESRSSF
jgi:hypothetical protein